MMIIAVRLRMIIVNIINNLPFCGQDGLAQGSAAASLYKNGLGFGTKSKVEFLWAAILVTIISVALMFMFIRSKYGRAIRAIRDDEIVEFVRHSYRNRKVEGIDLLSLVLGNHECRPSALRMQYSMSRN